MHYGAFRMSIILILNGETQASFYSSYVGKCILYMIQRFNFKDERRKMMRLCSPFFMNFGLEMLFHGFQINKISPAKQEEKKKTFKLKH